jgi:hypothetical protein
MRQRPRWVEARAIAGGGKLVVENPAWTVYVREDGAMIYRMRAGMPDYMCPPLGPAKQHGVRANVAHNRKERRWKRALNVRAYLEMQDLKQAA